MASPFPNLFSPVKVGRFTLKNRIAVAPHGPRYAVDGLLTDQYVQYEAAKIRGGAGLLIMSYGLSDPTASAGNLVSAWRTENVEKFRNLMSVAGDHDCRVVFQFGESHLRSGLAPTAVPHTGFRSTSSLEMTRADIARMMANYVRCAEVLMLGGLEGLELHGHGDLFSDFLSPAINRRADAYGGDLENRTRYLREAIALVRGVIGPGKILGARLSVEDFLPDSISLEEGVRIAARLAETGQLDYLSIDTSVEPQRLDRMIAPMYAEPGHQLYAAAAVKKQVQGLPIFCVGRILDASFADRIIAEGKADVVAMARALIADPELPNKAREGRVEDIRPCLGDNQECIGNVLPGLPLRCTVNALAGREAEPPHPPLAPGARKRILVVGGGPAGMEAARVAAGRGHAVTLWEQEDQLGGQVLLAERLPGRADLGRIVPWQARELKRLSVRVLLGEAATVESVGREAPDAVIFATGAAWRSDGFNGRDYRTVAGWDQPRVISVEQALRSSVPAGSKVVIYDVKGFVEAPGAAELLARAGCEVELVTPFPTLGADELKSTLQWPYLMQRILAAGVRLTTDAQLDSIEGPNVALSNLHTGAPSRIGGVDKVIIIGARSPRAELCDSLAAAGLESYRIGDCLRPANLGQAIADGHRIGSAV